MGKVRLKDLDCFISDGNYSSKYPRSEEFVKEGIPFIRCNNFKNNTITKEDMYYITKEKHSILQKGHLKQGDVLITTRGSLGQVVIVPKEYEDANINAQIVLLRVNKEKIYNRYLMWQLKSQNIQNQIMKNKTGTALPQLPISKLEKIELLIVDNIQEQIEIATKLDKIQEIIDIRKKQIEDLDKLIKFQFVEMFGEPTINQKRFPVETVGDIIEFQGGSQPDKKKFEYVKTDNNIRLIQIRDYKTDDFITYIPKELARRFCCKDDIMIGRYGPPIFQILQGIDGAYNVALMKAIPKKGNREFIRYFLKQECLLQYLERMSQRTAGQAGIEMPKLKKYPFPYPPIELQNQFAGFVKLIDKQKCEIQKSLEEIQKLQESLMSKCFGD